jgi:hypothetical protein
MAASAARGKEEGRRTPEEDKTRRARRKSSTFVKI